MSEHENTNPQTESEYASVEELTVKRDSDGELLAVEEDTPMFGTVLVKPMPYGEIEAKFGDTGDVANVNSDVVADLIADHVVEPDMAGHARDNGYAGVSGSYVREELKPLAPRDLILAVLSASDVEADVMMDDGGNAQVALEDEGNRR